MCDTKEINDKNNKKKNGVMPFFYWGDLVWLKYLIENQDIIKFSLLQTYRKQRNFNRTYLLGGNGIVVLTIPVSYEGMFPKISEIKICYKENWQKNHLKKIYYAYKNSAYFEYYWNSIEEIYKQQPEFLWEFNYLVIHWLKKHFQIQKVECTNEWLPLANFSYRLEETPDIAFPQYYQLFSQQFISNLSSLDLLMNLGVESEQYLKNISLNYNDIKIFRKK
jgi:hypothetical protein